MIARRGRGLPNIARTCRLIALRALPVSTQRAEVAEAADSRLNRCQTQSNTGQINAPIAIEARIAEIGRSKHGRMLPSDLINDVTNACSTMVPITIPSTIAATG